MEIELDQEVMDVFTVTDQLGALVTGVTGFTFKLFNPSGTEVSGSIVPVVTELSSGHYEVTFTPNAVGTWTLTILHATYFPAGITNVYNCTARTAILARILGLTQENFCIDQQVYVSRRLTSARMRIYSDAASVTTTYNVLATYTITATYTDDELSEYKVVKD